MKLEMTWGDVAAATGGRLARGRAEAPFHELSTDSRTVRAGQTFWALRGDHFDAHQFLDEALAARSAGWVVAHGRLGSPRRLPAQVLEVPDTLAALQSLARAHRRRSKARIAAVTGSNGKTTTKEMLRSICARLGPTAATSGNFNNQLGLPLSLLELTAEHRFGIFEMGASHPGDIRDLAAIAEPDLGILTNIGPAHLEFFGTLEATFAAKRELVEGLAADAPVVLNGDDPFLARLIAPLGSRAVVFGKAPGCAVRILGGGRLEMDGRRLELSNLFGELSLYNAAASAAAAGVLGAGPDDILKGLSDFTPPKMRLERRTLPCGARVIFDAYNANPASMRASLEAFLEEEGAARRIAVLGDMKELGGHSERYHRELGEWLSETPLDGIFLAGPEIRPAFEALGKTSKASVVRWSQSWRGWERELKDELGAGSAGLLKASRAMKFEDLLAALEEPR